MKEKESILKAFSGLLDGILGGSDKEELESPVEVCKTVEVSTRVKKSLDEEQRKATFIVLAPDEVDLHGDTYSAETIEKACDNFRENCMQVNLAHLMMADDNLAVITESYIAPDDMNLNGVSVKKGSWLQTWKFNDESIWEGVKSGYWNGLSVQCNGLVEDLT